MNTPIPSLNQQTLQEQNSALQQPTTGMINLTHVIYALHAVSIIGGILGPATVVGLFVLGWPSLIGVLLNYLKRSDARGTWLESHFRWQIRTFWFGVLWGAIATAFIVTIIGLIVGLPLLFLVGLWVIYRIARGWLALVSERPMPI